MKEIISWVQVLLAAIVIAFLLDHFIIANSTVPTGSMESTIMPGDRVIGLRLKYTFGEPERGDIAIFIYPDDEAAGVRTYYVKRIIGMPGDTVDVRDGHVYLNGSSEPLDESMIKEPMMLEEPMHFEVPENCYFMLGDNRNYSNDSRRWHTPYVERQKLIAKVYFKYFPGIKWLN
ncbi:MAG: signal peptidase I [Clostridium sp.]|nr:signal peptidase I [Clostridium sp.]MBQ5421946.1 signal peptidase I [Clostridium sp.]